MALFDEDFDMAAPAAEASAAEQAEAVPEAAEMAREVALDQAWNDGYAAGSRQALDLITAQTTSPATDHAQSFAQIAHSLAQAQEAAVAEAAAALSLQFHRLLANLFPMLMRCNGPSEITALVAELLRRLSRPSCITIRLAPEVARAIGPAIETGAAGLDHRVSIRPATDIAVGDAEIIWERGALHRKTGPIQDALTRMLAQHGLAVDEVLPAARASANGMAQPPKTPALPLPAMAEPALFASKPATSAALAPVPLGPIPMAPIPLAKEPENAV